MLGAAAVAALAAVWVLASGSGSGAARTGDPASAGPPTAGPAASVGSPAPSAEASAPASPSAPPPDSHIQPGSIDRTSIRIEATYDAAVHLAFDARRLSVDETITITNRSGDGIDRVELNTIAAPLGDLRLAVVEVDGTPATASVHDQTIVVPLGGVLPDGAGATLRVRFRATIPSTLTGSNWMFTRTGDILQASRWLPWVGLRHPFGRPNHGDPFFTALSPSVRVAITADRPLVIAAPGRRVRVDGLTQVFEAENVRDFHVVASPGFRIHERRVGDWTLRAYVRGGFETEDVLDWAADGLRRMSRLAGDYPYELFTIAQTAGGYALEGPGMIWIPTGLAGSRLRWNVYHETAHQWFYGLVGSDGALDPYADEAVATHLGQVVSGIWRDPTCGMRRLDLSIYRYSTSCYFSQIYLHGANLLDRIRRLMSGPVYWAAVRDYVEAHRFGIGSTRELLETLEAHSPVDLRPLLARWFPSLF